MALIVEDGTGLSTAESYISVAAATAYFTAFGNADAWTALDTATQETLLRKSSRDLDMIYGESYESDRLTTVQALLFPRVAFTDRNGRSVSGVPTALAQATAELALLNSTTDVTGSLEQTGNVKTTRTKVDVIETSVEYFTPTSTTSNLLRKVGILMRPLLAVGSSGMFMQIVRG